MKFSRSFFPMGMLLAANSASAACVPPGDPSDFGYNCGPMLPTPDVNTLFLGWPPDALGDLPQKIDTFNKVLVENVIPQLSPYNVNGTAFGVGTTNFPISRPFTGNLSESNIVESSVKKAVEDGVIKPGKQSLVVVYPYPGIFPCPMLYFSMSNHSYVKLTDPHQQKLPIVTVSPPCSPFLDWNDLVVGHYTIHASQAVAGAVTNPTGSGWTTKHRFGGSHLGNDISSVYCNDKPPVVIENQLISPLWSKEKNDCSLIRCSTYGQGTMPYNCGPVIQNPEITPIFINWPDTKNTADFLEKSDNFTGLLVQKIFPEMLHEYSINGMTIGPGTNHPAVQLSHPGLDPTDESTLQNILQTALRDGTAPPPKKNSIYRLFPWPQEGVNACSNEGGHHGFIHGGNGYAGQVPSPGIPYIVNRPCFSPQTALNFTSPDFDEGQFASVDLHEGAETITDPFLNGYYNNFNATETSQHFNESGEIGDVCHVPQTEGYNHSLQQLWSNAANACVPVPGSTPFPTSAPSSTSNQRSDLPVELGVGLGVSLTLVGGMIAVTELERRRKRSRQQDQERAETDNAFEMNLPVPESSAPVEENSPVVLATKGEVNGSNTSTRPSVER